MCNYAKHPGWTYIGFAEAANVLVVHLRSWRASRPARVRGDESIVSDDVVMAMAITFADEPQRPVTLILTSPPHDNLQPLRDIRRITPVRSEGL
jgi:hypothetical protein